MPVVNRMQMFHDEDPAVVHMRKIGNLAEMGIELLFSQILVMDYQRPEKLASGLLVPGQTRDEERYQGKSGLVIMKGPTAFVDQGEVKFFGQNVNVGEWVIYRRSDGWEMQINECNCRVLQDVHVKMKVPGPDTVW